MFVRIYNFSPFELLLFLVQLLAVKTNEEDLKVHKMTPVGRVDGVIKQINELNRTIEVYLSVRYAMAPIKKLRFKDPVPLPKDPLAILGSSQFPPTCSQTTFLTFEDFEGMELLKIKSQIDEDCLFLNIWKPCIVSQKVPVIVWIHGGGFNHGSTSLPLYDGSYLAALTDAVVVSIQYRLGAFGFLYTGDDFAPGNAGLKDQILALKWVNEHIDKFGGDKERITIVGQSAGGVSVGFLVLNPEANKLFKRAIMLSGSPNSAWTLISSSEAKEIATELAIRLGADNRSNENIKKHLISKSFHDILTQIKNMQKDIPLKFHFLPTIGPHPIPDHPVRMLKDAKHLKGKELIAGWTKDEGSMFLAFELNARKIISEVHEIPTISEKFFKEYLAFNAAGNKKIAEKLEKLYEQDDEMSLLQRLSDLKGDVSMKCPTNEFIEETRKHGATVYNFEFGFRSNSTSTIWPKWMGIVHGADLEMLFALPFYNRSKFNEVDVEICKQFVNHIKNFVHNGNPNKAGQKDWYDHQMFEYTDENVRGDNRTSLCANLLELIPHYLSGSRLLRANFIGVISVLVLFFMIL